MSERPDVVAALAGATRAANAAAGPEAALAELTRALPPLLGDREAHRPPGALKAGERQFSVCGVFLLTPDQYLDHIRKPKEPVKIPIIGSLNGVSSGGWIKYARLIEEAGADALELNMYFVPTDPDISGGQIEDMFAELVSDVKRTVSLPIAVKLSPFFTSIPHMAKRLAHAGADALVLFNRFYQPDFDLETLDVITRPELSTLQTPQALRLPLTWIAILYGRVRLDLALTSGVHCAEDALKAMMAGANVAMMASELILNGIDRLPVIRADMIRWMEEHEYASVAQMRGSMSQQAVAFPAAFERAHYMRAIMNLPQ